MTSTRTSAPEFLFRLSCCLVLLAVACGPGPKGESLVELEALRESNYTRAIRQDPEEVNQPRVRELREHAIESMDESDDWYDVAIEAWEALEDEKAEEFARQGVLLYRAAEAHSRAGDARERMEDANANYQIQIERRNRYNDMVAANEEVIALLLALQELYTQTEDCRADLMNFSAGGETRTLAVFAIQDARMAQRTAGNLRADEFSEAVFNEGASQLSQAMQYLDAGELVAANDVATRARGRFEEAVQQTAPQFQDLRDRRMGTSANRELFDAANALFGDNSYVDARGIVIVMPDLFPDRRAEPRDTSTYLLDQVVGLLNDSRHSVVIEGHTSDRGTRETNIANSQSRAERAQEYFLQHDIRSTRISVEGFGEDYPRYFNSDSDGRANNNRLEVIFLYVD